MGDEWKARWKAVLRGQRGGQLRVETRTSVAIRHAGSVQVKIIVVEDGAVTMSMNGTAEFTPAEFTELGTAVGEAKDAMRLHRHRQTQTG